MSFAVQPHNAPAVLEMFSKGGRDQYWYEGIVIACLYVIMSAAILGTYSAASWKRYVLIVDGAGRGQYTAVLQISCTDLC